MNDFRGKIKHRPNLFKYNVTPFCNLQNSIDEVLATLAGMGFDIDKCQAAVNAGKVTVQAAVDW